MLNHRIRCMYSQNSIWFCSIKTYDMRSTLGAQMQTSVEMRELSKKTQFHLVLFIALFFANFSWKPKGWVPCGISLQKEIPKYSHVQQLNNCKQPDLESLCPKLSNVKCLQNSSRGGGLHSLAHGLYPLHPFTYQFRSVSLQRLFGQVIRRDHIKQLPRYGKTFGGCLCKVL